MPSVTVQQAFALALEHHQAGRWADAEALYRQILAMQPRNSDTMHLLGVIAHQKGQNDSAMQLIGQAIALNPMDPGAHSNLGIVLQELGRLDEAISAFRRAVQLNPNQWEAHSNLGNVLRSRGDLDEAIGACRRALELNPGRPEAYNNLGNALGDKGLLDEAVAACQRAIELEPDYVEGLNNLGTALAEQRRLDEAVARYGRALQLQPGHAGARTNLGNVLKDQGRFDEALEAYRHVLRLKPEAAEVHSNLIYTLHFHPGNAHGEIADEQRRWNQKFGNPVKRFASWHGDDRNPARRLRVGYVSADFRDHVVGRNLLPLFRQHDHQGFEFLCYSGVVRPDQLTEEFRRCSALWRSTVGVGDEALADLIHRDGVDILVDLTQHMAGTRLPVFARRPAPVQASFAGYPESTGVEAIEYRISDRYLESEIGDGNWAIGWKREPDLPTPNSDLRLATNEQVFLIDSFWCYDPCGSEVKINELPAEQCGCVTFGSLNNFCKANEPMLKRWARVLGSVNHSRLVLLSGPGSHRQRTVDFLEREGIAGHRVEFCEPRPRPAYLELHRRLDIVLDTFPYNGHTTSLDALWMGVPVVTLAGQSAVSRAGLSQLSNLGLPELAAHSEDEYVSIAARLAGDLARLAELRKTLRARMEASVLMDVPRFARGIETAYRAMWRRWCAQEHCR